MNHPISLADWAADINDPLIIQEISDSLLLDLSRRIEKSQTLEQLVSRESELDEVWRLLDFAIADARRLGGPAADIPRLELLRNGVMEAHDLVGVDNDRVRAAARLRDLVGQASGA